MKYCIVATVFLVSLLLLPVLARAHKVMVFAWVEGHTVHTESKFSGGKRVKGGQIEVFDHTNQRVVFGTTDDQGRFDFSLTKGANRLKIVLTSGMGHTNHWTLGAEELGGEPPLSEKLTPATSPSEEESQAILDAETIEEIVTRSLEKQLAPLRAQMAQQSWGLRDIIAGVGYILGLVGLATHLRHRLQKPEGHRSGVAGGSQ